MKILIKSDIYPIIINCIKPGIEKLGYSVDISKISDPVPEIDKYDKMLSFGWNDSIKLLHERFKKDEKETLSITDGYLKSNREFGNNRDVNNWKGYFGISRNFLNSYGYHKYEINLSPDRWIKLGVKLQPWKKGGNYILIAHQHSLDAYGKNRHSSFIDLINKCKTVNKNIFVSTHPNYSPKGHRYKEANIEISHLSKLGCKIVKGTKKYIENCIFLATYDSNSAVESVIFGKPIHTVGKTMADMVNSKDIKNLQYPDRTAWCNWIAYQQWTEYEILSGEAFKYYKF